MNAFTNQDRFDVSRVSQSRSGDVNAWPGGGCAALRYNERSYVRPTWTASALCAVSKSFARLAHWHASRTAARKTKDELKSLPDVILKDIGVNRGDINTLAEDLANRVRPCH